MVNRGAAFADGKIIFNTLDGQTIALDAKTGKPVWRTQLGNINNGETITMAPLVADGKVLVGNSGGEIGVRGWLDRARSRTPARSPGSAYHTGPDKDVLIGADFKPFYPQDRGKDLGVKHLAGRRRGRSAAATMWGWITYDPELTARSSTAPAIRGRGTPSSDPATTSGPPACSRATPTPARRNGIYQFSPHDEHDYDGDQRADPARHAVRRARCARCSSGSDRNGYIYVIDRNTGQVLSADPFGPVNSSRASISQTGRLIVNPDKETKLGQVVRNICPTAAAPRTGTRASFSPRTGLIYIPHENLCMDWMNLQANYISGTPYVGAEVQMKPGPGGNRGELTAWDPVRRKPVGRYKEDLPIWSGTVVTGGDLVFYGTMDGWFKAVDARNGKLVWQIKARQRDHRPADQLSRARTAINISRC